MPNDYFILIIAPAVIVLFLLATQLPHLRGPKRLSKCTQKRLKELKGRAQL